MSIEEQEGWQWFLALIIFGVVVVNYWQIILQSVLFAALVTLPIFLAYRYLFLLPRLSRLRRSNVVFIPGKRIYAIPIQVVKEVQGTEKIWVVKSVRPELRNNTVEFVEMSDKAGDVRAVNEKKSFSLDFRVARQISAPVKELYCQLEPKLLELNQKVDDLERIERLTRSSEVYSEQADLYSRAASQVRNLVREGKELRNECLKFIRETLIGAEVSRFEPDSLPDTLVWKLQFQEKYRVINEQYQTLREEVEALSNLRREIGSGQ